MKSQINKLRAVLFSGVIMLLVLFTACNQDNKNHEHQSMNMGNDQIDSTIIHTGVIDLEMIDKNKDGMVYQDPMDWNVISDKPGKCPLCKMKLEEVSIETARKNLIDHDFKVKNN